MLSAGQCSDDTCQKRRHVTWADVKYPLFATSNFRYSARFTRCRNSGANMDLAYVLMS
jgi:hypothetical protein